MLKTIRVRLNPTKEQIKLFNSFIGASKYVYNYVIRFQQQNSASGNKFVSKFEFKKLFNQIKLDYAFLVTCPGETIVGAISDAFMAYDRFFKKISGYPKFRTKYKKTFYTRQDRMRFGINIDSVEDKRVIKLALKGKSKDYDITKRVYLEKIGWVKLYESERFKGFTKLHNPRVKFDGLHWYLTVGVEVNLKKLEFTEEILGIDLGIKDMVILSNGKKYKNINKNFAMKKLEKKKKRLQRKSSRLYQSQRAKGIAITKGEKVKKTRNQIKVERKVKKISSKISNIRKTYIQQTISSIVKTRPQMIVLEDLNIKGMLKNKKLSKSIQDSCWGYFSTWMRWKCLQLGIEYKEVPRFYPSSKVCSSCGTKRKYLGLQERIFKCPKCGLVLDRDVNAAINISKYLLLLA